ncbi:MmpS family transport accessory protein [Mycolicibacterium iranicum]|uniref:MmpS family transport accessory protein n=1 Tax=Mycolicibacterium iranicum TaxID=912594 RepID=UPI000DA24982|nr:MmpS family transport accessory protein [Mycolicibacterium iranicum]
MTDSPNPGGREERSGLGGREERSGLGGRDEQWGNSGPGYSDPAYASQAPYGSPYQPPQAPHPTERLPAYPPYGYDPYATGQYPPQHPQGFGSEPPPEGPKSPRWLWIVAGVAVVLVIGLVIALVIVNSSRQQTVVAPLPSQPEPTYTPSPTTTSRTPTTRTPTTRPSTPVLPLPTLPSSPTTPTEPAFPGATDAVVYTVEGTGRAINITYVDTGGLLQTEFNVMLPWSKEVLLPQPGETSASISIINVGREVTCSISVNGAQMDMRTGAGLTICTPER